MRSPSSLPTSWRRRLSRRSCYGRSSCTAKRARLSGPCSMPASPPSWRCAHMAQSTRYHTAFSLPCITRRASLPTCPFTCYLRIHHHHPPLPIQRRSPLLFPMQELLHHSFITPSSLRSPLLRRMQERAVLRPLVGSDDWQWLTTQIGARAARELPQDVHLLHDLTRQVTCHVPLASATSALIAHPPPRRPCRRSCSCAR